MSLRILMLSSMYEGNIKSFIDTHEHLEDKSYEDYYNTLRNESTEFCAAYTRAFRKLGYDANFIVGNDAIHQRKWVEEFGVSDSSELLMIQTRHFNPDVLWIDNLSLVNRLWINEARRRIPSIKLIVGYHCSPFNLAIIENLQSTDIAFTCTPGLQCELKKLGIRTFLVYHAFDDTLPDHQINKTSPISGEDFVFSGSLITGSRFHNERIRFINQLLDTGVNISLFVNLENRKRVIAKHGIYYLRNFLSMAGLSDSLKRFSFFEHGLTRPEHYSGKLLSACKKPLYGQGMFDLFRRSRVVLNMHVGVAGEYAGNMRMFEVTGAGSCLLTDNKKNITDLFEPGSEVVTYDNVEDCIDKARWLLDNEDARIKIARAGQKRTMAFHTVLKRCEQISALIENELERK